MLHHLKKRGYNFKSIFFSLADQKFKHISQRTMKKMDFQRWRMAVSEADGENSLRVTQQKKHN